MESVSPLKGVNRDQQHQISNSVARRGVGFILAWTGICKTADTTLVVNRCRKKA